MQYFHENAGHYVMLFYNKSNKKYTAYEVFQGGEIVYGSTVSELLRNMHVIKVTICMFWCVTYYLL